MKKVVWCAALAVLAGAAGILMIRSFRGETVSAQAEVSMAAAESLRTKIDAAKAADRAGVPPPSASVEVSEAELKSYVLFFLRKEIPAKIDALDIHLTPGSIVADAKVTLAFNATGNSAIDAFVGGTHALAIEGDFSAENGRGRFSLDQFRMDGIPVPPVLVESLLSQYVKPRYPQVDLGESFVMPWGIEKVVIASGKATVEY